MTQKKTVKKSAWQKFKAGWMTFAEKLGFINSTILLTVIFIGFISIYGIFYKLFSLFKRQKKTSTWEKFSLNQNSIEELKRQF